jgi:hypothetical protein
MGSPVAFTSKVTYARYGAASLGFIMLFCYLQFTGVVATTSRYGRSCFGPSC